MPEIKRIGRNMGRIELLAVMSQVNSLLEAGYDRKKIHCRLMEEGGITMSYSTFCYQLKKHLSASAGSLNPAQGAKTSGPPKNNQPRPFTVNRNPKFEDFV